jgi:DNA repair exonuclease SbcCD ATPase subunit
MMQFARVTSPSWLCIGAFLVAICLAQTAECAEPANSSALSIIRSNASVVQKDIEDIRSTSDSAEQRKKASAKDADDAKLLQKLSQALPSVQELASDLKALKGNKDKVKQRQNELQEIQKNAKAAQAKVHDLHSEAKWMSSDDAKSLLPKMTAKFIADDFDKLTNALGEVAANAGDCLSAVK